jgi:hypothetical protein
MEPYSAQDARLSGQPQPPTVTTPQNPRISEANLVKEMTCSSALDGVTVANTDFTDVSMIEEIFEVEKEKAVENEEKKKDGAVASSGNELMEKEGTEALSGKMNEEKEGVRENVAQDDKDDMRMQDDDREEKQRKVKETECAEVLLMMKEERDILDKERAGKDGKEKQEEDVRMQDKEKEELGVRGTVMHGVHDSALFYSMVLLQFIVEWGHSMLVVWGILKSTCWHRGWLVSTVGVG